MKMYVKPPHVLPYQGSKRKLAQQIGRYIPEGVNRLFEPFAGSAAFTLAMAANDLAKSFVIADKLEPLANLWSMIIDSPEKLIEEYAEMWNAQLDDPSTYYLQVRERFNRTRSPSALLYLSARCVKNAIRFNGSGDFNQGADKRRLGLKPERLAQEVRSTAALLRGKVSVQSGDFREVIKTAQKNDLVYMDPPWQGTSGKRDPRYAFLLDIDELVDELSSLNQREIPYILSFDGVCGEKTYGQELPVQLKLEKILLNAGRSSQSTLLGRSEDTIEALYLSPSLMRKLANALHEETSSSKIQDELFAA